MAMKFGPCRKCGKDPADYSGTAPCSIFDPFYCAPGCQPEKPKQELSHELEAEMLERFVEGSHLWGDVMMLIRMAKTEERERCAKIVESEPEYPGDIPDEVRKHCARNIRDVAPNA